MERVRVDTVNSEQWIDVYSVKEFDALDFVYTTCRKKSGKRYITYINDVCTFDIETTTIKNVEMPYSFMYAWVTVVLGKVFMGRTIDEYLEMCHKISDKFELTEYKRLCMYVHNLSYDYVFIKDFFNFTRVFARKSNKILTALTDIGLEFRCSYFLSNMSLEKFLENSENVMYRKYQGAIYDYNKLRTPSTLLTEYEKGYICIDGLGLYEAVKSRLVDDTVSSIPLTSTGYVRRAYRIAMSKDKSNYDAWQKTKYDADTYRQAKAAYRGGNTHASRFFADRIVRDVFSFDLQSSYPYVIMSQYVPVSTFRQVKLKHKKDIYTYVNKYCVLMDIEIFEFATNAPIPYIAQAKCIKHSRDCLNDNGRLLGGSYVKMSITEIDFDIIMRQYNLELEQVYISNVRYAERGLMPEPIRHELMHFYDLKTRLKGVKGKEYEYGKSKNNVNATYGMAVTDIANPEYIFDPIEKKWTAKECDIDKAIERFYGNRNNFLSYMYGVWICAQARKILQTAIDIIGRDIVYVDTDSVKFVNHKLYVAKLNAISLQVEDASQKADIPWTVYKDSKPYTMGIWDFDGYYYEFKTLGAKKYAYQNNHDLHITVAGMSKVQGARRLKKLDNFKYGWSSYKVGRTTAKYNFNDIHYIYVNGEKIKTASNIALLDTSYTLGYTDAYFEILWGSDNDAIMLAR